MSGDKKAIDKEVSKAAIAAERPSWVQKGDVWYLHNKDGRIFGKVKRTSADVVEAHYSAVIEEYIDIHSAREALMAKMTEEILAKSKVKT